MDKGFDVHKFDAGDAGKASTPSTLQAQCRAAVLEKTGMEKPEDIREKLNLPRPLIDFLAKSFGTKDFFINKGDVTAEDINSGTFKATCLINKECVLLKCVPNSTLDEENKAKVEIWRNRKLSNIQKCLVSFQEGHKEVFVLESGACALEEIIESLKSKDRQVDEESIWLFVKKFTEVMNKLKENGLRYEDLKLSKIGLDKDGDLSLSNPILYLGAPGNNDPFAIPDSGQCAIYSPPEAITGEEITNESNIWIFGAILYELAMLKPAYTIDDSNDIFASLNVVVEGSKPQKLSDNFSPELQAIIWSCLNVEKSARPTLEELRTEAEKKAKASKSDLKTWLPASEA